MLAQHVRHESVHPPPEPSEIVFVIRAPALRLRSSWAGAPLLRLQVKKTRVVNGPLAYECSGQEPRTSPEYVPPGGNLTHALGTVLDSECFRPEGSSNPTVSRGQSGPSPGRPPGLGQVSDLPRYWVSEVDCCPPLYGGWAAPPPRRGGQLCCLAKEVWCVPAPVWGAGRAPPPQGGAVIWGAVPIVFLL